MIKEQLVEIVRRRLTGQLTSEQQGSFDSQLVAKYISLAFNTILWEVFRGGTFNLDNYTKRYPIIGVSTGVTVTYDTNQDLYYSTLPVDIVQLPRVGTGVMKIQTMKGTAFSFVPVANQEVEMLDGQEVDLISTIIRYTVKGDIIEYVGMNSTIAAAGVKMDLVRPFDAYDWDEDVKIPSGQDQRLVDMAVNFANGQPIDDQINNNQQDNRVAVAPSKGK